MIYHNQGKKKIVNRLKQFHILLIAFSSLLFTNKHLWLLHFFSLFSRNKIKEFHNPYLYHCPIKILMPNISKPLYLIMLPFSNIHELLFDFLGYHQILYYGEYLNSLKPLNYLHKLPIQSTLQPLFRFLVLRIHLNKEQPILSMLLLLLLLMLFLNILLLFHSFFVFLIHLRIIILH